MSRSDGPPGSRLRRRLIEVDCTGSPGRHPHAVASSLQVWERTGEEADRGEACRAARACRLDPDGRRHLPAQLDPARVPRGDGGRGADRRGPDRAGERARLAALDPDRPAVHRPYARPGRVGDERPPTADPEDPSPRRRRYAPANRSSRHARCASPRLPPHAACPGWPRCGWRRCARPRRSRTSRWRSRGPAR